jgi:peptidoglycan/xylan/chitin deacetylase (PgdA/CDA1 family)
MGDRYGRFKPARLGRSRARSAELRERFKQVLFRSGLLTVYHRLRNNQVLTVTVFHRVLARDDPRFDSAHAGWTVTPQVFRRCLEFFSQHYSCVSLNDLLLASRRERPLPSYPMLITFDDGYADNFDYAFPLLREFGVPAVIFVSSNVVDQTRRPWTEDLLWAFDHGFVDSDAIAALNAIVIPDRMPCAASERASVIEIVRRGAAIDETTAQRLLAAAGIPLPPPCETRQMLTKNEIVQLFKGGIAIGAHGSTHAALPHVADLTHELRDPREVLGGVLACELGGGGASSEITTLSFPHGLCTAEIKARAMGEGYELLFTTEETLSVLSGGYLEASTLGRIGIDVPPVLANDEDWLPRIAWRLFTRPRVRQPAMSATLSPGGACSPSMIT